MSPTTDGIAEKLGRQLEEGDISITDGQQSLLGEGVDIRPGKYEVTGFTQKAERHFLGIQGREKRHVIVRGLTSHGPTLETQEVPTNEDLWTSAIRREERTDRPSLRER